MIVIVSIYMSSLITKTKLKHEKQNSTNIYQKETKHGIIGINTITNLIDHSLIWRCALAAACCLSSVLLFCVNFLMSIPVVMSSVKYHWKACNAWTLLDIFLYKFCFTFGYFNGNISMELSFLQVLFYISLYTSWITNNLV